MSGDPGAPARMLPEITERNRAFWTGGADGQLHIPYCRSCARWVLPAESRCPACDTALISRPVSGAGTVFTFTVNGHPFNPAVPPPYVIAIVELAEQADLRLAANIVDCDPDSVAVGLPVTVRFERQTSGQEAVFVPVFTPDTTAVPSRGSS